MSGPFALLCIAAIVALATAVWLLSTGVFDERIAKWLQTRGDRESMRAEEAKRAALSATFPRVMRP